MTDVAVVIPAYQAEPWIAGTVASVRAQTHAAIDLVVVDDGSTDGTAHAAQAAGARVLRQPNAGPAAARNFGVAATHAPLLAFLDADDRWLPGKLSAQLPAFADPAVVACCCDAFLVRDGARAGRCNERRVVPARLRYADLLAQNPVVASSAVVRRDAFTRAGGFDPAPELFAVEDYDLWLRLARLGPIAYVGEPLLEYRRHAGSLGDNRRFVRGLDRIAEKLTAADADPAQLRQFARRRAQARVDLAYDELRAGDHAAARAWLREARTLGAGGVPYWKLWLRARLPR